MPQTPPDKTIAPQIELAVRQLDALSILPATAAQYFSKLLQPQASPLDMAEIIEADPAMTAKVFSLAHEKKIRPADIKFSIRNALEKLPEDIVHKAFFPSNFIKLPTTSRVWSLENNYCCTASPQPVVPLKSPKSSPHKWNRIWHIQQACCTISEHWPSTRQCPEALKPLSNRPNHKTHASAK